MDERCSEVAAFAELGDFIHQPVKNYSSGMRARLAFAFAVHSDPESLLLTRYLAVGRYSFFSPQGATARNGGLFGRRAGTGFFGVPMSPTLVNRALGQGPIFLPIQGADSPLQGEPGHLAGLEQGWPWGAGNGVWKNAPGSGLSNRGSTKLGGLGRNRAPPGWAERGGHFGEGAGGNPPHRLCPFAGGNTVPLLGQGRPLCGRNPPI